MSVDQIGFVITHGDFRMQDWLLKAELSAGAKLTYSVLACCAGGRDYAWPSQEYLAEKVSVCVRTLQRYLNELVRFGLIEKCRRHIKGQIRNVYRFLLHSVIGGDGKGKAQDVVGNELPRQLEKHNILRPGQHDKMPPCSLVEEERQPDNTTNCQTQRDKMSPSLNKEETIKGNNNIPPTPQEAISTSAPSDPPCDDSGKEGGFLFGAKEEDSNWKTVKEFLAEELSAKSLETWIEPLIFELDGDTAVLKGPNQFFINWVSRHFQADLSKSFEKAGISNWKIELQTEEQLAARAVITCQTEVKKNQAPAPVEDFDLLPVAGQYEAFYKAYPRHEKHLAGFTVFRVFPD